MGNDLKLGSQSRVKLANLPTPLQELPRLSKALKGPRIFVKRDDLTGLAFGGNKTRKLEYLMTDAIEKGSDYIVTYAGFHSNWCTQAAAAAKKLGMSVVLVKSGPVEGYDPDEYDGNHLLHVLMGAEIKVSTPEKLKETVDETMKELKKAGHKPYLLEAMGSTPPGAIGYANAILELLKQSVDYGIDIDYLVHASGSGGTQAGLVLGAKALNTGIKIIGVTTGGRKKEAQIDNVYKIIGESQKQLDVDIKISREDVVVYDEYAGEGYGFITEGKAEAIKMAAELEALIIDPVYTACSLSCLIDLCRKKVFKKTDTVVFLHTGGSAALFPYKEPLKAYVKGKALPWSIPPWSPSAK